MRKRKSDPGLGSGAARQWDAQLAIAPALSWKQSVAALILLATLLVVGLGYLERLNPGAYAVGDDAALHLASITRIGGGESYYRVVGDELRTRGYPSAAVPNWRTPLHYSFVALIGTSVAKATLLSAALLAILLGSIALHPRFRFAGLVAAVALIGTMLPVLWRPDRAVLFAESWAGVLIALSLAAYHLRWFRAGAGLAIGSAFFREIAFPYALVCGLLALRDKRKHEVLLWMVGAIAYVVYLAIHASLTATAIQSGPNLPAQSWLRFLGWPFVLQTVWVSGWTVVLPYAATPIAGVLGLSGLAAASIAPQLGWSVFLFTLTFFMVGQEFNYYWGWVTAPLWTYALFYAPEGGARLLMPIWTQMNPAGKAR
jgi:hypothetical protein